jgi:hypothetical protein
MKAVCSITAIAAITATVPFVGGCGNTMLQNNPSAVQSTAIAGALTAHRPTPWIADNSLLPRHLNRGHSWMGGAKSNELLYVSDIGAEDVDVFSYPGGEHVGTLTGFDEPNGLCADSNGNIFITDTYHSRVVKYAHGGTKPIEILQDSQNHPIGCAIDNTTGNLAVTNYNYLATGTVAIYKKARGTATLYNALWITYFCTYDNAGNLYIDGFNTDGTVVLGELKKGSATLTTITLSVEAGWAGGLEWDGKHVAFGDQLANKYVHSEPYPNAIYQLSIKNGVAKVVKTAPLANAGDVVQFWLQGKTVIGPDAQNEDVGFWKYPLGGSPTKTIGGFYEPVGAAVSADE